MFSNSTQSLRRPDLDTQHVAEATDTADHNLNAPRPQRPPEPASGPEPRFFPPAIEDLPLRPASLRGVHFGSLSAASIASAPSEASSLVRVSASAFSVASASTSAQLAVRAPAYGARRPRSGAENAINRSNIHTRAQELCLIGEKKAMRVGYAANAIVAVGLAGFVATITVPLAIPSQRVHQNSSADILRIFGMGLGSVSVFFLGLYVHRIAYRIADLPVLRENLAAGTLRMADVETGAISQ